MGEGLAHDVLVFGRGARGGGFAFSGLDVEGAGAVETLGVFEGDVVALAFGGVQVQEDGLLGVFGEVEVVLDLFEVVSVDGADIADAVLFKEGGGNEEVFGFLFPFNAKVNEGLPAGDLFKEGFDVVVEAVVNGVGDEVVKITCEGADVFGDGIFVVVENDDEALSAGSDVVKCFHGDAASESGVAANGDHVFIRAAAVASSCHTEGCGESSSGMTGAIGIVRAFGAVHESAEAVVTADFVKGCAVASSEEFVDVGLVGNVEDKAVLGGVKDAVQGDGKLDHAKVGAYVPAVAGGGANDAFADFAGEFLAVLQAEVFEVSGRMNLLKEGHGLMRPPSPRVRVPRGCRYRS
jgi:hypothetical protein